MGLYRAHHPLRILIDAEREEDILHSFLLMSEQMDNFWLPTFPEITGDSRRMNSNHGVITLLDAHVKGLENFDLEKAYLASKGAIMEKTLAPWSGAPSGELDKFYHENGYIPALRDGEGNNSKCMGSAPTTCCCNAALHMISESCSACKEFGLNDDYEYFIMLLITRNIYNKELRFPSNKTVISLNHSIIAMMRNGCSRVLLKTAIGYIVRMFS